MNPHPAQQDHCSKQEAAASAISEISPKISGHSLPNQFLAVDREGNDSYSLWQDVQQPESRSRLRVLLLPIRLFWRGGVAELKFLT